MRTSSPVAAIAMATGLAAATSATCAPTPASGATPAATRAPGATEHGCSHGDSVRVNGWEAEMTRGRWLGLVALGVVVGADLLVAGAFGHPRLREFIFGGATRTFLNADSPSLFLSH